VVVGDAQPPIAQHLEGQVPVAEVPGEAREVGRTVSLDVEHVLRRRMHREPAALRECQPVAVAERRGCGQIEQDRFAAIGREANAPAVTVLEAQRQAAFRPLRRPCPGPDYAHQPPHARPFPIKPGRRPGDRPRPPIWARPRHFCCPPGRRTRSSSNAGPDPRTPGPAGRRPEHLCAPRGVDAIRDGRIG
jgi:hypothetical protein